MDIEQIAQQIEKGLIEGFTTSKYPNRLDTRMRADIRGVSRIVALEVATQPERDKMANAWHYLWYEAHHVPQSKRIMPSKLFMKGSYYNP